MRRRAEALRAAGLRVWFDEWVIQPGDDIYLAIERGLEASRTLLLCLSQVRKCWRVANRKNNWRRLPSRWNLPARSQSSK